MLAVSPSRMIKFATFRELFQRIRSCRVEQTIVADGCCDIGIQQRLRDQAGHEFGNIGRDDQIIRRDRLRCIEREGSGEHGQPAENPLFGFQKSVVTPIECSGESLVPRKRGAPAMSQKADPVLQPRGYAPQSEYVDAPGRQFDRQCDPVESTADVGDNRCIDIAQFELTEA